MNMFKWLFKKKNVVPDFNTETTFTWYAESIMDLRGEIKGMKKYLPIDVVNELEYKISQILEQTCRNARSTGYDLAYKDYQKDGRPTMFFNPDSFDNDVYKNPNCIYDK